MGYGKAGFAAIALAVVGSGAFFPGRDCEERVPPSESGEKWLHYRPQEIDRSIVGTFELKFNGIDVLQGHPRIVHGEPVQFSSRFAIKPDALTVWQSEMLTMGHRRVEQGVADWTPHTTGFDELVISPERQQGGLIDFMKPLDLSPGEYELRFFLLVGNDRLSPPRLPEVYHIARGKLTVLPATAEEHGSNEAPAGITGLIHDVCLREHPSPV